MIVLAFLVSMEVHALTLERKRFHVIVVVLATMELLVIWILMIVCQIHVPIMVCAPTLVDISLLVIAQALGLMVSRAKTMLMTVFLHHVWMAFVAMLKRHMNILVIVLELGSRVSIVKLM
jgi:hypothetical protein